MTMTLTGVMHMHSTHSYDGKMSLVELKELLQENGVSFCCMTEHTDKLDKESAETFVNECRELSDESFLFIPGFEVPYQRAHVLQIGATEFLGQYADAAKLKEWRAVSPLVVLAHPVRNRFVVDEVLASVIDGVEIWNQQYEGKRYPRFRSRALYRTLAQNNEKLLATGGIDLHRKEHFSAPLISLEADSLSNESVLAAIKQGRFTTQGKEIELSSKGEFIIGGGFITRLKSLLMISVINLGKLVNATLARFGLHLPKQFFQAIRSRI